MKNEITEIQPFFESKMDKFFHVAREVEVFDNKRKYIADFVLTCRESGIKLGVECKSKDVVKGSEVYDWVMQAYKYSMVFNIPFFVFPHIQNRVFFDSNHSHKILCRDNNVSTFLGRFGVGEVLSKKQEHKQWEVNHNGNYLPPVITKFIQFEFVHSSKVIWKNHFDTVCVNLESYKQITP